MRALLTKITIGTLLSTLVFTGCGPFSSNKSNNETITLTIGQEVEVFKGYELNPTDDSTQIEIRHLVSENKKFVTLVSGSAQLVKK